MSRVASELTCDVTRLTIPVLGVHEFQSRYEAAVPDLLPLDAVGELIWRRAP
jgi:hypothetical protein